MAGMYGSNMAPAGWPGETYSRPSQLFIAHAPQDQRFAETLAIDLRQRGFLIESGPANAPASALPRLIQQDMPPDCLVVVLSPAALWSPVIAEEMRLAAALLQSQRLRAVLAIAAVPLQGGGIPPGWPVAQVFDAARNYTTAVRLLSAALSAAGILHRPPGAPRWTPQSRHAEGTIPDETAEETAQLAAADDIAAKDTIRPRAVAPDAARPGTPAQSVAPGSQRTVKTGTSKAPGAPRRKGLITRRTLLGAGAVIAASALAGASAYYWRSSQGAPTPPGPSVRWRFALNSRPSTLATSAENVIYVGTDDGHLYALDAASHAPRWVYAADAAIAQPAPVASGGSVYVTSANAILTSLSDDPAIASDARRLRWRFHVNDRQFLLPAVGQGVVYAAALFNRLYALDDQTGAVRWLSKPTFNPSSPPTLIGNRLYVAAAKSVFALDASSGEQIWQGSEVGTVYASMPVVKGIIYVSSLANAVYALDAATGEQRWSFTTADKVYSTPTVDTSQGAVYIGGGDSFLYALDAASGTLRWRQKLDSQVATPVLANGLLYVTTGVGYVYALDPSTGAVSWQYAAGQGIVTPLGINANTLYAGTEDGYLYALGIA